MVSHTQWRLTVAPGVCPVRGQAAIEGGQDRDEVVEATHLPEHVLLARVQLEDTQHLGGGGQQDIR